MHLMGCISVSVWCVCVCVCVCECVKIEWLCLVSSCTTENENIGRNCSRVCEVSITQCINYMYIIIPNKHNPILDIVWSMCKSQWSSCPARLPQGGRQGWQLARGWSFRAEDSHGVSKSLGDRGNKITLRQSVKLRDKIKYAILYMCVYIVPV